MKIFVCAGMEALPDEKTAKEAVKIGKLLGQAGITLLQGGSDSGMMGLTLNEFLKHSDDVEMIIPEIYKSNLRNLKYKKAHIVPNLAARLHEIIKQADAIIVLPGGTGTVLELFFTNEAKRAKECSCDIIIVNTNGFYDGLKQQMQSMIKRGFTTEKKFTARFVDEFDLSQIKQLDK